MGKLIRWSLVALVVALIVSNINIKTSLYKAQDNSLEISFPQWKTKTPWLYLYWTPGVWRWQFYKGERHQYPPAKPADQAPSAQ
ncbi:MAG: hypothetical protein LRY38_06410 [Aeromonadaceae bacterium]|nr:hypothetical protein [Aeromonadaceae bacterium]